MMVNLIEIRIFCINILKLTTVEPIIFLIYFGWVFGNTIQSPGLYRKVCQIYYTDVSFVNCSSITNQTIEQSVQQHSAEWAIYNAIAYLTPAIFADTILGAYGDRYGRKLNIMLGIAGIAVSEFGYMLTLSNSVNTPYYTVPIFGVITGATGYIALVPVSCNAYLADITPDMNLLTIRSGIFSVAQMLSSVFGGLLAAVFSYLSISLAIDIELSMYMLAMFYVIWRIPQRPGITRQHQQQASLETSSPSRFSAARSFAIELIELLRLGFRTYSKPRIGHRRAFMFVSVLVLMITYTTAVETRTSTTISTYVFRRAMHWQSRELGYWNGSGYMSLIIGTLSGLYLFKRVLHLRETTIIIIGIVSSSIRTVLIGLATTDAHMYVANFVGLFAGLAQPAIVSFMAQLVPFAEIGKAFSLFGIAGDLAYICTNLIYSNIYRLTVGWFPGFLFLFIAGIQMVAACAMLWVHFQAIRENIGVDLLEAIASIDQQQRHRRRRRRVDQSTMSTIVRDRQSTNIDANQ